MKKLLGVMVFLGIAIVLASGPIGCSPAKKTKDKDKGGTADNKSLTVTTDPADSVSLDAKTDADVTKEVVIKIARGDKAGDKDGKLTATVDPADKDVSVKIAAETVKKADDGKATITVKKGADTKEYKITFKVTADGATDGTKDLTVKVTKAGSPPPPKTDETVKVEAAADDKHEGKGTVKLTFKVKIGKDAEEVALTVGAKKGKDKADEKAVKVSIKDKTLAQPGGDVVVTVEILDAAEAEYTVWLMAKGKKGAQEDTGSSTVKVTKKAAN